MGRANGKGGVGDLEKWGLWDHQVSVLGTLPRDHMVQLSCPSESACDQCHSRHKDGE